jgi:hypothetical protein
MGILTKIVDKLTAKGAEVIAQVTGGPDRRRLKARRHAWFEESAHRAALTRQALGDPGWQPRSLLALMMPACPHDPDGFQIHFGAAPPPEGDSARFRALVAEEREAHAATRESFVALLRRLHPGKL